MKKIRIMIVEDHPVFGYGLRRLADVEPDLEVIAQIADGAEAVEQALRLRPDVILMDVNLPTMNGLQATRRIKRELDETGIIVLTAFHDEEQMLHALRAGASAYFPKDIEPAVLVSAVRTVAKGEYVIGDQVMSKEQAERWCKKEIERLAIFPEMVEDVFIPLTPREMEILELIAKGASNKEIARMLSISNQTVKNHISSILRKLDVSDRTQAAVLALRRGWIRLESIELLDTEAGR